MGESGSCPADSQAVDYQTAETSVRLPAADSDGCRISLQTDTLQEMENPARLPWDAQTMMEELAGSYISHTYTNTVTH